MKLRVGRAVNLPKLAWVAELRDEAVEVRCGTHVEEGDGWIVEALWDGPFDEGGFDRTSAVFGGGIRLRDDEVWFVASASCVDRLWIHRTEDRCALANSLPSLMSVAGGGLLPNVEYRPLLRNLPTETGEPTGFLPVEDGTLTVIYARNVGWDGSALRIAAKPPDVAGFPEFAAFERYLRDTCGGIGRNARSTVRRHPVELLMTISSGYDSPAVSVLAREAGCERAVTIRRSRSLLHRPDSGARIARRLGLACAEMPREGRGSPHELEFYAAAGTADDVNLVAFDFPGEVTGLFTGAFGGLIWAKRIDTHPALVDFTDPNTLGFCEYRLSEGVVHCPIPYLGYRHALDILRITVSPEMRPWSVPGHYDRPIPRRIVEEARVPRQAFGQVKKATQYEESVHWPYPRELRRSYAAYLERIGREPPPVAWYRVLNALDRYLLLPLEERGFGSYREPRVRLERPGNRLFPWAVDTLADRLAQGPRRAGSPS